MSLKALLEAQNIHIYFQLLKYAKSLGRSVHYGKYMIENQIDLVGGFLKLVSKFDVIIKVLNSTSILRLNPSGKEKISCPGTKSWESPFFLSLIFPNKQIILSPPLVVTPHINANGIVLDNSTFESGEIKLSESFLPVLLIQ